MITTMDQVTIVRRLLECLHAMRQRQLACEDKQELKNQEKLIASNNRLSLRAYLAVKAIEGILLSDQNGDLSDSICLSKKSSFQLSGLTMEDFTKWAADVNWLLSVMEGFKP